MDRQVQNKTSKEPLSQTGLMAGFIVLLFGALPAIWSIIEGVGVYVAALGQGGTEDPFSFWVVFPIVTGAVELALCVAVALYALIVRKRAVGKGWIAVCALIVVAYFIWQPFLYLSR